MPQVQEMLPRDLSLMNTNHLKEYQDEMARTSKGHLNLLLKPDRVENNLQLLITDVITNQ